MKFRSYRDIKNDKAKGDFAERVTPPCRVCGGPPLYRVGNLPHHTFLGYCKNHRAEAEEQTRRNHIGRCVATETWSDHNRMLADKAERKGVRLTPKHRKMR